MLMHFLFVMLRLSAYRRQSVSLKMIEKGQPAWQHGIGLTGSLDGRALENAHYHVGTGLAGDDPDDDKRKPPKLAVPETCVECQH